MQYKQVYKRINKLIYKKISFNLFWTTCLTKLKRHRPAQHQPSFWAWALLPLQTDELRFLWIGSGTICFISTGENEAWSILFSLLRVFVACWREAVECAMSEQPVAAVKSWQERYVATGEELRTGWIMKCVSFSCPWLRLMGWTTAVGFIRVHSEKPEERPHTCSYMKPGSHDRNIHLFFNFGTLH